MKNNFLWIIALLVVGNSSNGLSQQDTAVQRDTMETEEILEALLEQSSVEEDSPILDVLPPPTPQLSFSPQVNVRSRLYQRLQQSLGYQNSEYLGSRISSYHRLLIQTRSNFSGGLLIDKDAGEPRVNDFTSGHLQFTTDGLINSVVVGDYIVEVGQGLALWRGFDFSKGAEVVSPVVKEGRGLIPYLSSGEAAFFRGAASRIISSPLDLMAFYSVRSRSGSIDSSNRITSLSTSGYFRTTSERDRKDNVEERIVGFHSSVSFSQDNQFGVTMYRTSFSDVLWLDDGKRFSGQDYSLLSLDYTLNAYSAKLFGEWGGVNNTIGGISGILLKPDPSLQLVATMRHYPYRFVSLHGLGFSEGTSTSNEQGFYLGLYMKLNRWVTLSSYYDQFNYPQSTSSLVFPASGNDFLTQIECFPSSRFDVTARYSKKIVQSRMRVVDPYGFTISVDDAERKQSIRLGLGYQLSKNVRWRGRVEKLFYDTRLTSRSEKGFMLYNDLHLRSTDRLSWNVRLIFFDTDSYDSRIYEYEQDLKGVLTLPSLYGRGIRWYVIVRYAVSERLDLSLKYSDHIRDDVKRIGSGLDELATNHDNRIGMQMDLKL